MILSAFGFALMGVFIKGAGDLPVLQKMIFRSYIIASASFIALKMGKTPIKLNGQNKYLLLRSVFGTIGMICSYYAIDNLILSDATILNKMSTFFFLLTSYLFLGEKLTFRQFIYILLSFIGVIFIVKPEFSVKMIPYLVGLTGAFFAALAYTVVRMLGQKVNPTVTVFYFAAFGAVILTPLLPFAYKPMSVSQIIYLVLAGLSATIGQMGLTHAYKFSAASEVSIYNYIGVIFSAAFSIIIFHQTPNILSIVGYIIVFATTFLMYKFNSKKAITKQS